MSERHIDNIHFTVTILLLYSTFVFAFLCLYIMLLAGDIHPNPGPLSLSDSMESLNHSSISSKSIDLSNHLSFVHYNVQSVSGKLDIIWTELKSFDIIGISETWLSPTTETDDLMFKSFSSPERKDRVGDNHGGLLLYIKESIHYMRRPDLELIGIECIWVEVKIKSKDILFGLFYRPPNSTRIQDTLIEDSIGLAFDGGIENVIIVGDLNLNPSYKNLERKLHSLCEQFSLSQCIEEPTHFTERSSSMIDIILVNNQNLLTECGVGDPFLEQNIRYHCPIYGIFNCNKVKNKPFRRQIWNFNSGDYEQLRHLISSTDWESLFNEDVDLHAQNITDRILKLSKRCIYNRNINIKPNEPKWLTSNIKCQIRKRKRAYRKAKRTNSPIHWEKFRQLRNNTINLIRIAKSNHTKQLAQQLGSGNLKPSNWWKTIKDFISPQTQTTIPSLQSDNGLVDEEVDKANLLNNFFCIQTHLDDSNVDIPVLHNLSDNYLSNINIAAIEVEEILSSLPLGKAVGPDGVNNRILRELSSELSSPLSALFNHSLQSGKMPTSWKEANVCPIFKSGDHSLTSNYRPISLLNTVNKVFEKVIFKHLYNFFRENNTISSYQSGFMPGDSTSNQLAFLYHTFCEAIDSGLEVRTIFCDISKAFDRVWHKGLIVKLKASGITGTLLDWCESYLSNRRQRVILPGTHSSWNILKAGVPQGSILGPLLFLIYINDIVTDIGSQIRLFADDTSLYLVVDNPMSTADTLNRDLQRITDWAKTWLVKFNPTKTESMVLSRKSNKPVHPPICMLNQDIPNVEFHKHLGVYLTNDLSWRKHIEYVTAKAWKRINIMKKLKFTLDRASLETVYFSFIRPILEYSDVLLSNCSNMDAYELEKVQYEAARIVTGATKLVSIEKLLKEVGWETLEKRRYNHRLILFYKMINNLVPSYLSELVPTTVGDTTRYSLRNAGDIQTFNTRTNHFQKSFLPQAIMDWNNLPQTTKDAPSLSIFKKMLHITAPKIPKYFYNGDRRSQILHARLRTNCSFLKNDLYLKNMSESPRCICGQKENANHFLLKCENFSVQRVQMIERVRQYGNITLSKLLFGDDTLTQSDNEIIFGAVQTFIRNTNRFV